MSDTPETDGITFFATKDMMPPYNTVPAEFARKLERERDEARDDCERLNRLLRHETALGQGDIDHWAALERERDEQTAQMCQAIGYLSDIAEDCEAWLNGECEEPSMEFIKAVRDYAKKAINA